MASFFEKFILVCLCPNISSFDTKSYFIICDSLYFLVILTRILTCLTFLVALGTVMLQSCVTTGGWGLIIHL